jgi:WD40 repeat protein
MCGPARGGIVVWDARTWKEARKLDGHPGGTSFACFSPDGRTIASTGVDGTVKVWDVATGREIATIGKGIGGASRLKFAEQGRSLVVGCADGTIRIFAASKRGRPQPKSSPAPKDDDERD